jgi:hypothetical protein
MKIAKSEVDIRDFLAKNLDMIEPGLMLQKKEQYLKNDNGALVSLIFSPVIRKGESLSLK